MSAAASDSAAPPGPPHDQRPPEAHWDGDADSVDEKHLGGGGSSDSDDDEQRTPRIGILLLVWIHGFKGSATSTFGDFPARLAHMLQASHPHIAVASEIYPTYDTRGSLARASDALLEWLTTRTVELECKPALDAAGAEVPAARSGRGLGAGSVRLILCGHSMGGLIAVDAAVSSASSAPPGPHRHDQLWPRICGVVAFDTPYYGVHPKTFANAASKYGSYLKTAHSIGSQLAPLGASLGLWGASQAAASSSARKVKDAPPQEQKKASSGWSTALLAGSAVALAAGGATAGMWYGGGYEYMKDHMLYVGNLWDEEGQKARLERLVGQPQIYFRALYNRLPPASGTRDKRTFIVLPPAASPVADRFEAVEESGAADEVDAHTTMFTRFSPGYATMGLRAAAIVSFSLDNEQEVIGRAQAAALQASGVKQEAAA